MTPVIPFPEESASKESFSPRDLQSGISFKSSSSPLLGHLKSLSGDQEIQEVIQLLHDIRHFQDHPEMVRVFDEHRHEIAHHAKDHNRDILELLIEDYLKHNDLMPTEELSESQKLELEFHIKLIVMSALKGYQEVVETIRSEIRDVASRLKEDESIHHVKELVKSLRDRHDRETLTLMFEGASELDEARHVLQSDRDDVHDILAEIAMKKGHRNHENASRYLKEELHETLRNFDNSLQVTAGQPFSHASVRELGPDIIQRNRHASPRLNAALSLLEGLKLKRVSGDLPSGLPDSVVRLLHDSSDDNIERTLLQKSSAIHTELTKLEQKMETLAALYLKNLEAGDYKIQRGLQKISRIKAGRGPIGGYRWEKIVPDACPELRAILDDEADLVSSITKMWLREDYGNIEFFDRLVEKITSDAQCYLDSDSPPKYAPSYQDITEKRENLVLQLENPRFGSAADHLKQILRAVSAGFEVNPALQTFINGLPLTKESFAESLADDYLNQKQWNFSLYKTFEDYLAAVLWGIQESCDETEYSRLLSWSPRHTILAAAAPPYNPPFQPEADFSQDLSIPSPEPSKTISDKKNVQIKKEPYVYEGRHCRIEKDSLTEIVYAMAGSVIEVERGAKLDLFMAGDNVTIRLKGTDSRVRIQKAGHHCKTLTVVGPDSEILTGNSPYAEFGEGVAEKLKTQAS